MYTTFPRAVRTGRSDVTGSIGSRPCANGTITGRAMASASGRPSHPELVVCTTGGSGIADAWTRPAVSSRTTGPGPVGVPSIRSRRSPEVGPGWRTTTFTTRLHRSEDLLLARNSFSFSRCFTPVSCSSRPFAGTSQSHVAQWYAALIRFSSSPRRGSGRVSSLTRRFVMSPGSAASASLLSDTGRAGGWPSRAPSRSPGRTFRSRLSGGGGARYDRRRGELPCAVGPGRRRRRRSLSNRRGRSEPRRKRRRRRHLLEHRPRRRDLLIVILPVLLIVVEDDRVGDRFAADERRPAARPQTGAAAGGSVRPLLPRARVERSGAAQRLLVVHRCIRPIHA